MPYRIAFVDSDDFGWVFIDYFIDGLFILDIFVNFFSAYFDEEENLIIEHKVSSI
jgi:hypothetical protein